MMVGGRQYYGVEGGCFGDVVYLGQEREGGVKDNSKVADFRHILMHGQDPFTSFFEI